MNGLQTNEYERIARKLNGSDEALTDRERAAADEIRQLEEGLRRTLDIDVPPEVVSRLRERLAEALRRRRRVIRLRLFSGVAAAAGLLLAMAVAYWARGPASIPKDASIVSKTPVGAAEDWYPDVTNVLQTTDRNADLLALDREMSELEAAMVASVPAADVELDALERELGSFVTDGGPMLPPGL